MNRELLRAYLLDTLDEGERARVDALLAESAEARAELEAERAALDVLDVLPEVRPPHDLATRAIKSTRRAEQKQVRAGRRLSPLFASAIAMCAMISVAVLLLPALSRARESARRSSVENNMKQFGLVCKMYANESPGNYYPPAAPYPDVLTIDLKTVWPEYLNDPSILCTISTTSDQDVLLSLLDQKPVDWRKCAEVTAANFVYFPWMATQETDLAAIINTHKKMSPTDLDKPLAVNGHTFPRLNENMEDPFWKAAGSLPEASQLMSKIPVLMETEYRPGGLRRILYLDGHVTTVRYGAFPCTKMIDDALGIAAPNVRPTKKRWSCSGGK